MKVDLSMIRLPWGFNAEGKDRRLEECVEHFRKGLIGGLQVYVPLPFDGFLGDVEKLRVMQEKVFDETGRKFKIDLHAPHNRHRFNLLDGLTDHNNECIDATFDVARSLGSDFVVVHPEGNLKDHSDAGVLEGRIQDVFRYLADKSHGFKVLLENMPGCDNGRHVIFSRPDEIIKGVDVNELRKKYALGLCFDFTHCAISTTNFLPDAVPDGRNVMSGDGFYAKSCRETFPNSYNGDVARFLVENPDMFHISGCDEGDTIDRLGPFTKFNIKQLRMAGIYNLSRTNTVPIVLELPFDQWNVKSDDHNLRMAVEVLSGYQIFVGV
jgi:endonuclease IV